MIKLISKRSIIGFQVEGMIGSKTINPFSNLSQIKSLILVFFLLIGLVAGLETRRYEHGRWQEQDRKLSEITDVTWNYCDVKCTYLQTIFPAHDFVVIYFRGKEDGDQFGACYIKIGETYFMWNQLVQNDFYSRTCGLLDQTDYLKESEKYELVSVMAIGKGVEIPDKYSAF